MSIKSKRIEAGYTQEQLADILGISRPAVTLWETGVNSPRSDMLPKIANLLHCTIDDLFDSESPESEIE